MHYYLYCITNKMNGMIYIGVHETLDLGDGYMGSGHYLRHAMKKAEKLGINPFVKEVIQWFDDSDAMYAREAEIVDWDFIQRDDVYNIRLGGRGGWGHLRGMITVKTTSGKILKVSKDDPRFATGELVGNTKGLRYFNDGERTYRLRADQVPEQHWKPGRAWSPKGQAWYNDGTKSFFILERDAAGLQPGRLALANIHLKGRGYFNDGTRTFRLHQDDPRVKDLFPGRIGVRRPGPRERLVSHSPTAPA